MHALPSLSVCWLGQRTPKPWELIRVKKRKKVGDQFYLLVRRNHNGLVGFAELKTMKIWGLIVIAANIILTNIHVIYILW